MQLDEHCNVHGGSRLQDADAATPLQVACAATSRATPLAREPISSSPSGTCTTHRTCGRTRRPLTRIAFQVRHATVAATPPPPPDGPIRGLSMATDPRRRFHPGAPACQCPLLAPFRLKLSCNGNNNASFEASIVYLSTNIMCIHGVPSTQYHGYYQQHVRAMDMLFHLVHHPTKQLSTPSLLLWD